MWINFVDQLQTMKPTKVYTLRKFLRLRYMVADGRMHFAIKR